MGDESSVLSQAEIDALFRQATGANIARPAAPAPVPPTAPVVPPPVVQVKSAPVVPAPKPQAVMPPPQNAAVSTKHPAHVADNSPEVKALIHEQKTQLDELIKRVAKLEASLLISQSANEGGSGDSGFAQQQLIDIRSTVRRVVKQTAGIQKGLEGTPAYNLAHEFTCTECGSEGHLAIPVTCTNCGKEGWWGWWPTSL